MQRRRMNDHGQMQMVGAAVGLFITLIVAVLIYFNIAGTIDTTTIDANFAGTPAANATDATNSQASTFFTIAPIIGVVIVAVVIIGYVNKIGS